MTIITLIFSCNQVNVSNDKDSLPSSSGKYGEVLIVVDTFYQNRKTGEALDQIFFKALEGMPQQEAQFRASTVPPKGFQSILKRSRNILKLSVGKGKKTAINIEEDVWAKDQLLLQITAGSDEDAARILEKNTQTIRNYFNEKEIERLHKQFSNKPQKELMKEVNSKMDIELIVPPGFVKMSEEESGLWLKKEKTIGEHLVLQGISIYSYPYETDSVFLNSEMISTRNKFTAANIQGMRDSSYMVVYDEYSPQRTEINLNGVYSVEYRGLWKMENDFMGGPFLHYTFVNEENNKVYHLDGFVYAPKFEKREYLRELEAILKTMKVK